MYYMNGTLCSVSVRLFLFPATSPLPRLFSSTQLTAVIQTVASIVSLVNGYHIFRSKPTLGFLNPLLYSPGFRGVKDILFGTNPGCGTDGFPADVGWDPVRPNVLVSFPNHF